MYTSVYVCIVFEKQVYLNLVEKLNDLHVLCLVVDYIMPLERKNGPITCIPEWHSSMTWTGYQRPKGWQHQVTSTIKRNAMLMNDVQDGCIKSI
jgi:hypothetical protein